MILPTTTLPQIGDRITDHSTPPDDSAVREWVGPQAFGHWAELRNWIDEFYPAVFEPDWLYGGKNRGWSLRYKKTKAFTTLVPEYRRFSAVVVMGGAELDATTCHVRLQEHSFRTQLIVRFSVTSGRRSAIRHCLPE